jgi:hypothetical protein
MNLLLIFLFLLFPQKPTCYKVVYTAVKGGETFHSWEDTCMSTKPNFVHLTVWIRDKGGFEKVKIVGVYPKEK